MFRALDKTFALGKHHHPVDIIAEVNGVLSGLALFPQLVKTVITKDTAGLSALTFGLMFVNCVIWVIYGKHRALPQVIISSTLSGIASLALFFLAI